MIHTSLFLLLAPSDCRDNTDMDESSPSQWQPVHPKDSFNFHCHSEVPCFLVCCANVHLLLYPYDVLRLKQRLGMHSGDFLAKHVELCEGSHPFFPGVKLRLSDLQGHPCPFLGDTGCCVYEDRPSACRTYPLERGVGKENKESALHAQYFLTKHPWCKGHAEEYSYSLRQWEREQGLHDWNLHNDYWAELNMFFGTNPCTGEGKVGPMQQLAFMVCYNIDAFREYVEQNGLLEQFSLNKAERRGIRSNDDALLVFGFKWLEYVLGGRKLLIAR